MVEFVIEADAPEELRRGKPDDWKEDVRITVSDAIYDEVRGLSDDYDTSTEATIRRLSQLPQVTIASEVGSGENQLSNDELVRTIFAALISASDTATLRYETNRTELAALARSLAEAIMTSASN
ncbi:MAG: hypothetical protein OXN97_03465 [Bryobacterales bacterium]|nr:hypothetical protein [Bryobacterales bacterium]